MNKNCIKCQSNGMFNMYVYAEFSLKKKAYLIKAWYQTKMSEWNKHIKKHTTYFFINGQDWLMHQDDQLILCYQDLLDEKNNWKPVQHPVTTQNKTIFNLDF